MVSYTLLASASISLVAAVIYAYVGHRLTRRASSHEGKLAAAGFVAFWYGLAITTLLGGTGLQAFLAATGSLSLAFALALGQIGLLAISVALWGLLYYLTYLYTGRRGAWLPIAAFYALFYLFLQYFIIDAVPQGLRVERWSVSVSYEKFSPETNIWSSPFLVALVLGLLIPQILASLAYLSLYVRVHEPTQRYRILLVSLSILVWFASPFVALGADISRSDWYQLASRFIGLGAAVVILLAYHPPGWIRRRYGILSIAEETKPEDADTRPRGPSARFGAPLAVAVLLPRRY